MLSRTDIEYLKRVNGLRKKLGLSLDEEQFNAHSFLTSIAHARHQSTKHA